MKCCAFGGEGRLQRSCRSKGMPRWKANRILVAQGHETRREMQVLGVSAASLQVLCISVALAVSRLADGGEVAVGPRSLSAGSEPWKIE